MIAKNPEIEPQDLQEFLLTTWPGGAQFADEIAWSDWWDFITYKWSTKLRVNYVSEKHNTLHSKNPGLIEADASNIGYADRYDGLISSIICCQINIAKVSFRLAEEISNQWNSSSSLNINRMLFSTCFWFIRLWELVSPEWVSDRTSAIHLRIPHLPSVSWILKLASILIRFASISIQRVHIFFEITMQL